MREDYVQQVLTSPDLLPLYSTKAKQKQSGT